MTKKALFPGSFDPFTLGHASVIEKALTVFDHIVIGIGQNSTKSSYFDLEHRVTWIEENYASESAVSVEWYQKLTVEYAAEIGCSHIIRGLRNQSDFQYESNIAHLNRALNADIETVFFLCEPKYAAINSTIVREIHRNGGNINAFVPKTIASKIEMI